jgi:PAS domain S-box-containing protein
METEKGNINSTSDSLSNIHFEDVFNLEEIQRLQDLFSNVSGIASIITYPDGTPITKPSNFCRLCNDIIRKTELGLKNCYHSNAMIGLDSKNSIHTGPCRSCGLWDAGTSISVGGKHIANWIIGQIRTEEIDEHRILEYADEIGANKEDFLEALNEIQIMSIDQLNKTTKILYAFANELSEKAFKNLQLKMQMAEQEKATTSLRNSEAHIRTLLQTIPDLIWLKDKDGVYLSCNKMFERFFGAKEEDIIGKTDYDFVDRELADSFLENDQKAIAAGKPTSNEEWISYADDGQDVFLETIKTPMFDSKGTLIGVLGIGRDLTERKQAVQELTHQKYFFEQMFMQSSVSTQILDHEGWCERINPKLSELFGVNPRDLEGKVYNIFKDDAIIQGGIIPFLENAFIKGKSTDWEIFFDIGLAAESQHIQVKNKKKVWYKNWAYPIFDKEGKLINVIIQHNDITKIKHAEQELIASKEKAEESDRLKTAFLTNMSHEIRTPLNSIMGFAELLEEPDLSGEEQQNYISIIEKSGARMLNIINDIIDISKIESGQMEVLNEECNINEQIENIYSNFKQEVEKRGMQLFIKISLPVTASVIQTDGEKLYAILTNLVKNSIKYSDQGTIEIGYNLKNNYLEFFVKDSGIGIPKERQEAVFHRFVQADIADKRAYQGAGLGLSISKSYVEMLGGKIWVESEEGKGSSFYFTIPYHNELLNKVKVEEVITPKPVDHPIKKLKILIAEDDESSELLLTNIVKQYCREHLHAKTGYEAIEACRQNPDIDLVLMDIQLPEMNGYFATREIRKFNKTVIIIAQTAYALKDDREKALEAGCDDYISKPISQALLKELVNKHFNK